MLTIKKIDTVCDELTEAARLIKEYADELNENLSFQQFDAELKDPLSKYGPPKGSIYVAWHNKQPAGCIALQPLPQPGVCEMKRLYVRPAFRKKGIGEELVSVLLEDAVARGYTTMVLDTLARLKYAIHLYQRFGFENTTPYYSNPLPDVVYMEKSLEPAFPKFGRFVMQTAK